MQMVKLVGDLPGVTYLLAFDSRPLREALSTKGINGHEYLAKIVQVEHVLPTVSEERLYGMLDRELNRTVEHLPEDRIDPSRWPAVYDEIVRPLVKTPRHVRRLSNALALAITLAGDDVDLTDLIVTGLPDEVGPDEGINEVVQTAKEHAQREHFVADRRN